MERESMGMQCTPVASEYGYELLNDTRNILFKTLAGNGSSGSWTEPAYSHRVYSMTSVEF
jgi:hypothetical protein